MTNRTDLAIEFEKRKNKNFLIEENFGEIKVFFTDLEEKNPYNKKKGKYATIKIGKIDLLPDFKNIEKAICYCLDNMNLSKSESFLIVGLGNREIVSDSIGTFVSEKILATRHIKDDFKKYEEFSNLKSVSVITPSVLGKTGIEAAETVEAVVKQIKPDAVIVIDSLCAGETENLFSVIQFCNSGISPGSGVKNSRKEISFQTLGVPTVAIGVPTVVEASVIAEEILGKKLNQKTDFFVTPKESDILTLKISEIISAGLNIFLQPNTDEKIILSLV